MQPKRTGIVDRCWFIWNLTLTTVKVILHVQAEEQVLYPPAILIGEYAKLML